MFSPFDTPTALVDDAKMIRYMAKYDEFEPDGNEITKHIFFNTDTWHKTELGRKIKRDVTRRSRAEWCMKYWKQTPGPGGLSESKPVVCNEPTVCENCRNREVARDLAALNQSKTNKVFENHISQEEEEAFLKKVQRKGDCAQKRLPLDDGSVIILTEEPMEEEQEPILLFELEAKLKKWREKVDTLNGKKVSNTKRFKKATLKTYPTDEELEEAGMEVPEKIVFPALSFVTKKSAYREAEMKAIEEAFLAHGKKQNFEDLEAFFKTYTNAFVQALPKGEMVDYQMMTIRADLKFLVKHNMSMSMYAVSRNNQTAYLDSTGFLNEQEKEIEALLEHI